MIVKVLKNCFLSIGLDSGLNTFKCPTYSGRAFVVIYGFFEQLFYPACSTTGKIKLRYSKPQIQTEIQAMMTTFNLVLDEILISLALVLTGGALFSMHD
jgi:hypothetical protein